MDENLGNIVSDGAEILLDSLIENEILREIPVIGTSLNLIKGISNIRDIAYLNKVKRFVLQLGTLSHDKKRKLIDESRKDGKRRVKFGNAIFTAIEQSDSLVKVKFLAIAFEGFLNGDYSNSDFRLMCHIISNSFTDDLIDIIESETPKSELKYLVATGLADIDYEEMIEKQINMEPQYKLSLTSMQLREAWSMYNK